MTFNTFPPIADFIDLISCSTSSVKPALRKPIFRTMSISSAPCSTAILASCSFASEVEEPNGKPIVTAGATLEHIKLMKQSIGGHIKIKASGGIRDKETAVEYINAGADRIGTSSGIQIVSG